MVSTTFDRMVAKLDLTPKEGDMIAVWFSCGAASAVAAKLIVEKYGQLCEVRLLNNFVAEEDEDNRRFAEDVAQWVGLPLEIVWNPKYPSCSAVDVWAQRKAMSFPKGAPCTDELKKEARKLWELEHKPDWHVLGFTVEEKKRWQTFAIGERNNTLPILIDAGMDKQDCMDYLVAAGIRPPDIYAQGYPNANCKGCVKATSPEYWNHVRRYDPEIFAARAVQSRKLGVKLVRCHPRWLSFCGMRECGEWYDNRTNTCLHENDKKTGKRKLVSPRIFLDELPQEATGRPPKQMKIECGIFCEQ